MRIVITDDHGIVRDGIKWMLVNEPSIEVAAEAGDGQTLLDILEREDVDVVLLDLRMPGMSGLETLEAIVEREFDVGVLMLSMYDEPELVAAAVERGANGYLLKSAEREEIIKAIHTVGSGGSFLQSDLTAPLLRRFVESPEGEALPQIATRNRRILQLVANGHGNRQIAGELKLTEPVVKAALRRVCKRLNATGRSEAVAIALRLGLID